MDRHRRLTALLAELRTGRRWTAAELARALGVSTRTVLRDVATLVDAEVPVLTERGRHGGIWLPPGVEVDVGRLTTTEAEVLALVGTDLGRAQDLGFEAAARTASRKLRSRTGAARRSVPGSPPLGVRDVVTIDHRSWFGASGSTGTAALVRDLRLGRRLRIEYRSSGREHARTLVVDPRGALLRGDRWYLVADVDGSPRLFALSRLRSWEVLPQERVLRSEGSLATVAHALGEALEGRHEVVVTAELDADRRDLAERVLGRRLVGVEPVPGTTRVRIRVGYEQVDGVRQLLQFAEHLEVLGPLEARALVGRLAEATAHRHREAR